MRNGSPIKMAEAFNVGQLDLQDRAALRRVTTFSTELQDISEVEYRQIQLERVVLAGVWTSGTWELAERSLQELARLAETAGSTVLEGVIQRRDNPDPATYLGSGKAQELRKIVSETGADTVIIDGELSPAQLIHLEDVVKVKVVDRTWLILDIFAKHAKSREGKTQVSLAQMQYMLPRLRGWGDALSRQAASGGNPGIGTRGPGETKLETDRRRIHDQMTKLKKDLKDMARSRDVQRNSRRKSNIASVAIAGYTNAGKSSLLNRLTGAGVLVEDALFATLDPTVRKSQTPSGRNITLSDTVGFVRHLPHQLIDAFKSTLEEVSDSDLIVLVVDGSDPDPLEQFNSVREVLEEIGANNIPEIIAVNKCDQLNEEQLGELKRVFPNSILVSAHTGLGIELLLQRIDDFLPDPSVEVMLVIPYSRGDLLAKVHQDGKVLMTEHNDDGTQVHAFVPSELAHQLKQI
ncbi:MAG: GTPase HflX [Candidatus Nanopelagicales bacterium]|jgi:GTPase|nr:GTPase HflX [Candidatus Nanopelagicales bacterium]MDP4985993.1 GTPase HflX [Candidatus Nanopelagicales bacterium]